MLHRASTPNNFNLLRLFAAFLVLYGHGFNLNGLPVNTVLSHTFGLQIFFIISGYLIAISWQNDPHLGRFFWRRSLRIFPALAVVVIITAFVLGPLISDLSLAEYFSHPSLYQYFSNIALVMNYHLPGLFSNNPMQDVNGSLWSLPVEFALYVTVAFAGCCLPRGRITSLLVMLFCLLTLSAWPFIDFGPYTGLADKLKLLIKMAGYFWAGCCIYYWQLQRYTSIPTFAVILMLGIFSLQWPFLEWIFHYITLPFLVISFANHGAGHLNLFNRSDYSYGLYIYAFPVQQSLVQLFPHWSLPLSIGVCLLLTLGSAMLSWHYIEKPILRFKPKRAKGK